MRSLLVVPYNGVAISVDIHDFDFYPPPNSAAIRVQSELPDVIDQFGVSIARFLVDAFILSAIFDSNNFSIRSLFCCVVL